MPSFVESLTDHVNLLVAIAKNRLSSLDWRRTSDNYKRLVVTAAGVQDAKESFRADVRDSHPATATGNALDGWLDFGGLERRLATPASGTDSGLVKGADGSTWLATDTLTHAKTGLQFSPTAAGTMGATEKASIGLIALSSGSQGALEADEVLEWDSTPAGLESTVLVQSALDDSGTGLDVEGDDSGRARLYSRFQFPPGSGKVGDFESIALESSSAIARAFVYRHRSGRGSIDVAALKAGSGSSRILSAGETTDLQSAFDAVKQITPVVRVLTVIAEPLDLTIAIEPDVGPENSADWSGSAEVSSYDSGTRTIVFTADRPVSLKVGSRIVVTGTAGHTLIVESLSSTDGVVVRDDLGYSILAAATVYPGGLLTDLVRDEILALFDSLGPRAGRYGFGNWRGSLLLSLVRSAADLDGVIGSTVETPADDVIATESVYPNDDQVRLLTPQNLIVRYA